MWTTTLTGGRKNNIWTSKFCTVSRTVLHTVRSLAFPTADLGSVDVWCSICNMKIVPDVQKSVNCSTGMKSHLLSTLDITYFFQFYLLASAILKPNSFQDICNKMFLIDIYDFIAVLYIIDHHVPVGDAAKTQA